MTRCLRMLALIAVLAATSAGAEVAVTDALGQRVRLARPAQRIVSLAPHATELLFAVGAGKRIVGTVDYSDYPPAAREVPRVGSAGAIDAERVLALRPDLVVAWASGNGAGTIARLRRLGLAVYASEPRRLADIAADMERLATLSGRARAGRRTAAAFRDRYRRLRRRYGEGRPVTVFFELWPRPMMTVNGEHLISRVLETCGGRNVFADLPALVPTVGVEAVLAADPQAIIRAVDDAENDTWRQPWRRWSELTATRRHNLFSVLPDLINRPGPRLLDGAERICRYLQSARRRRSSARRH